MVCYCSSFTANVFFTENEAKKLVDGFQGDFKAFPQYFESPNLGAHTNVHVLVGGDLWGQCPDSAPANCQTGPTISPNNPIFFMHHAMVDKVWSDWQHKDSSNFWSFDVQALDNLTVYNEYPNGAPPALALDHLMPLDGLFQPGTIRDVMDTTRYLPYVYE